MSAPPNNEHLVPLSACCDQDCDFEVVWVDGEDREVCRLFELGLCVGSQIQVVKSGKTAILNVAGSRLAVASEIQNRLYVRPSIDI